MNVALYYNSECHNTIWVKIFSFCEFEYSFSKKQNKKKKTGSLWYVKLNHFFPLGKAVIRTTFQHFI